MFSRSRLSSLAVLRQLCAAHSPTTTRYNCVTVRPHHGGPRLSHVLSFSTLVSRGSLLHNNAARRLSSAGPLLRITHSHLNVDPPSNPLSLSRARPCRSTRGFG